MIEIVTREELENDKTIDRMIKEDECAWLTALGRRHRALLEKEGKFPRKICIGPQTKVWRLSEVLEWVKGEWKP
ncbi:TPA: helix-turn-helix transcriptional regulator [Escherichia coli]|jgi:prophage regulatory protein|uniref:AlpA family phage regulatory protein n=2 Tax=Escherichia coli TaxID=562 RepID=A0AAF0HFN8_ECOLX|nr:MULTISPECIES: AlpA family phage regulatory protein [Escherichia]EFA4180708.1 AlpA family phage regulatory protein [Escherichia coli O43:H14]ELJ1037522.1 AlpA family phage regulatory protein [Escherichia coli O2]EAB0395902.1 AlpA family phage regulatory protein [Escherichia coli]EET8023967.1 AlpA family phage regulatory protein [Escherichia coli]EEW0947213.1 AlpA family phage regulatory protein [Escherichia coli]